MDLSQRKLNRREWNGIEVPLDMDETATLKMIAHTYTKVNETVNAHNALVTFLKVDPTKDMEDYLYGKYFSERIETLHKLSTSEGLKSCFALKVNTKSSIKKADQIRLSNAHNATKNLTADVVYEILLIEVMETLITAIEYGTKTTTKTTKTTKTEEANTEETKTSTKRAAGPYFSLYKLNTYRIDRINRHVKFIVEQVLAVLQPIVKVYDIVSDSPIIVEQNSLLLKYSDKKLYDHQKHIFTRIKQPGPQLIMYQGPTGTGKTMTPLGISEQYRVIFVCAARHVGLALARSAIMIGKKIAFAFGCTCADDIRLHYFAAKDFTINKRSGQIQKVDNSIGDNVEIIISDVKSYLFAMYYMLAFNEKDRIVTFWDEPTISLDYDQHELHPVISRNWSANEIPKIILSSATLPLISEITSVTSGFMSKFEGAVIINILSHDCKKSIPIVTTSGTLAIPHLLAETYDQLLHMREQCASNLTLLRYFDLAEAVRFILHVEGMKILPEGCTIEATFNDLASISMENIKIHYLRVIDKIPPEYWSQISAELRLTATSKLDEITTTNQTTTNQTTTNQPIAGIAGIYVSTKDAYTLTDGPTLFLAKDVQRIAAFCIHQAAIPSQVMDILMAKIENNNAIGLKIAALEQDIDDAEESKQTSSTKKATKDKEKGGKGGKGDKGEKGEKGEKGGKEKGKERTDGTDIFDRTRLLHENVKSLYEQIKPVELNETFIPNKTLHKRKWAPPSLNVADFISAFTSDIDESTIVEIMGLDGIHDSWKIMLLMGIGVFADHPCVRYTEIMKALADAQRLFMIIAADDYIYGTNYQFCHAYLGKDLVLTQGKLIQALGRVGRQNVQHRYSIRLRDDNHAFLLYMPDMENKEAKNMNRLFSFTSTSTSTSTSHLDDSDSDSHSDDFDSFVN